MIGGAAIQGCFRRICETFIMTYVAIGRSELSEVYSFDIAGTRVKLIVISTPIARVTTMDG